MFKVFGIALLVLAIAIAVVPTFTDCQSHGKFVTLANGNQASMKCHWTGIAEIGAAVPLLVVGAMMTASRRRNNLTSLSVLGVVLGGIAVAFPSGLIGVCQTPTMTCVTTMKPALVSMGGLAVGISLLGLVLSRKASE
ncbi:MAG: DUF4418 family protein [Chloroflexi bacterium]|nr:DUF4418 family protein [Chloroflexota bacterium]